MEKVKKWHLVAVIAVLCSQYLSAQTVRELYNVGLPGISPRTLVTVEIINGKGYVGGDIEVGDEQTLLRNDLLVRNNPNFQFAPLALNRVRWGGGVVPITISGFSDTQINSIVQALNELTDRTNVSFIKRSNELDYVEIINDPNLGFIGGSSNLGKLSIGGRQFLRLNMQSISVSTVIHEMVHTLAFYHEHQRPDRETYVEVIDSNIIEVRRNNFYIFPAASTAFPYDCASIMHYSSTAFGRPNPNGLGTLTTIRPRPGVSCNPMGGRVLSPTDIQAINAAYPVETSNTLLNATDFLAGTPTITNAWMVQNGRMIGEFVYSCGSCNSADPNQYQLNITGSGLVGWELDNPSYIKASGIISSSDQFLKINILFKYNTSVAGVTVNTLRLKKGIEVINIPISTPFKVLD